MSPPLKSAQPGIAPGRKRRSPAGGAKKKTSCRVGRMRGPITSGKSLGSQGPSGEDEAVGADPLARRQPDFGQARRRRGAAVATQPLRVGAAVAARTGRPGSAPSAAPSARRNPARRGRRGCRRSRSSGSAAPSRPGPALRSAGRAPGARRCCRGRTALRSGRRTGCRTGRGSAGRRSALSAFHCGSESAAIRV